MFNHTLSRSAHYPVLIQVISVNTDGFSELAEFCLTASGQDKAHSGFPLSYNQVTYYTDVNKMSAC